jgi:TonB family protein
MKRLGPNRLHHFLRAVSGARALIAMAVLTVHVLALGPSLLKSPGGDNAFQTSAPTVMEVILLPPSPVRPPSLGQPIFRRIKLSPPPELSASKRQLAGPGNSADTSIPRDEPHSPPFERLVVDAKPEDGAALHQFCSDSYPPEYRSRNEQGTVVLLVRIESDGHVSDTTVEESSGSPRLDRVTQACVMAGVFEPIRSGWRTVASWQRIHWTWPNP